MSKSSTGFTISLRRDIRWLNHSSGQWRFKEGEKKSSPHKAWQHHSWQRDEEPSCGKKRSMCFTLAVKVTPRARQLQPAKRSPWEGGETRDMLQGVASPRVSPMSSGRRQCSGLFVVIKPLARRQPHRQVWSVSRKEAREKRSDEYESTLNNWHLTQGWRHTSTQSHWAGKTHSHFSELSFIDPAKGVSLINYSNACVGVAATAQALSDGISLRICSLSLWLNPVSVYDNITLLRRLPHMQLRTHTEIPPEGKTLAFYLWMWAARGEKPVPRSTVSEAGCREASLTSINLLSSHPSALHLSLSSSFSTPLFILGAFTFFSRSPLLRMSSSLFDLNVRCKGYSHHAALHYHCGFLASAKTSYSFCQP